MLAARLHARLVHRNLKDAICVVRLQSSVQNRDAAAWSGTCTLRDLVRCRARLEMSEESYSSTGGDGEGMGRLTTWLQQLFLRGRSNPSSVAMRRDHFSTVAMQRTPLCAHTSTCNSLPAACLVVCPPQPSFRTRTATQQQVCLARRTSLAAALYPLVQLLAAASSQLGAAGTTAIRPMPHAVHGSKKLLEYRDSREDTARPSRETASTFWQVLHGGQKEAQ
ncbi:hypothetical protein V8E36_000306 [Tilletia maclaganii]